MDDFLKAKKNNLKLIMFLFVCETENFDSTSGTAPQEMDVQQHRYVDL